ncbi:peroxisomal membrane protein 11B-like isoform X1 [Artemia franciscana]|uniref:Peroxisomal membrane protein 11B n=1 Tax=Artemia franciscana TaxID=6661 RepID=A0AA88L2P0_ARTSF|nr:hypothetical protein QYM36_011859 [Artemia franciscana]
MDTWMKLNSSVIGKDRLIRLFQYGSKLLWYILEQRKYSPSIISKLKNLEYHFGTFRKLLRFGKFLEAIKGAWITLHCADVIYKVLLTLSKLAQAVFLFADHILWIGRVGLVKVKKSRWSTLSTRCWLYAILLNLARDIYEIHLASTYVRRTSNRSVSWPHQGHFLPYINDPSAQRIMEPLLNTTNYAKLLARSRPDVAIDLLKNLCDVFIPLTSQGYTKLSAGVIGGLGVISSLAGLLTVVDSRFKL